MKLEVYEKTVSRSALAIPLIFFAYYFFPKTSFIITAPIFLCFIIKLRHSHQHLEKLLFLIFVSISGAAVFQRDTLFLEYSQLNTIRSPDFIDLYKNKLFIMTDALQNREFLSALTTGKRVFSNTFRKDLINTGTMHIVAISAFHVGLMIVFINYFLKILVTVTNLRPKHFFVLSLTLKICFSFYYFFITGASIPTLRALFFILFFDFSIMLGAYPYMFSLFLISLMAVCIVIPQSATSISFIMSALCVATIMKIWKFMPRSITIKMILTSIILNYILIPVSTELNSSYSLSAPLVNLLVIPIVSLTIPFITCAQFLIPFSEGSAEFFIMIADKLISPATFSITFFGNYAEMSLIPLIEPQFGAKVLFVSFFFCALFSSGKLKPFFIILNFLCLLPFHFNFQTEETKIYRPVSFYNKAACIVHPAGNGSIILDKFTYNPDVNDKFIQRLEKACGECGINRLNSIHLQKKLSRDKENFIKKRLRFNSTRIYYLSENIETNLF